MQDIPATAHATSLRKQERELMWDEDPSPAKQEIELLLPPVPTLAARLESNLSHVRKQFTAIRAAEQRGELNQKLNRSTELFTIPDSDPRGPLRGQQGIRARLQIIENTVFVVSSKVLCESDYDNALPNFVDYVEHERYVFALEGGKHEDDESIIADLASGGNRLACMNDPINSTLTANMAFFELLVKGFPQLCAIAIGSIQPGEELLASYGDAYWGCDVVGKQRREGVAFSLQHMRRALMSQMKGRASHPIEIDTCGV